MSNLLKRLPGLLRMNPNQPAPGKTPIAKPSAAPTAGGSPGPETDGQAESSEGMPKIEQGTEANTGSAGTETGTTKQTTDEAKTDKPAEEKHVAKAKHVAKPKRARQ